MLTPAPTLTVIEASGGIHQDKMATLKARIRAIDRVNLYDPMQAIKVCLVQRSFMFLSSSNIVEHNAP